MENNLLPNKLRQKKVILWLGIVLFCLTVYSVSFVALRHRLNCTLGIPGFVESPNCAMSVRTYYFSNDDPTNRKLYYLFLPIHRVVLRGRSANELVGSEFCDIPPGGPDRYWESLVEGMLLE